MQAIRLWKIATQGAPAVAPVQEAHTTETEALLEEVLTSAPDMLVPGIGAIGRQIAVKSGYIDLLGIDDQGRIIIFELKKGQLTRDAVAQIIDYGACISELSQEDLCVCLDGKLSDSSGSTLGNFRSWYEGLHDSLEGIGRPRLVLVGVGVDERAKRMVDYLTGSDFDIQVVTFHVFKEGGDTYLARQVEAQPVNKAAPPKEAGRVANQLALTTLSDKLHVTQSYQVAVKTVSSGLGAACYAYPYPTGWSFFLPGTSSNNTPSKQAWIGLYLYEEHQGKVWIYLQTRTTQAIGVARLQEIASQFGCTLKMTPTGYGNMYVDAHKLAEGDTLANFSQEVANAWAKAQTQEQLLPPEPSSAS